LSELAVLRAGIDAHAYLLTAVLAVAIAIGFCAMLWHVTGMVGGESRPEAPAKTALPRSCRVALAIAAVPMLLLGVWVPLSIGALWTP
jgi:formate hydrogenlyase subunit 3/multisubunit Na+/H+ antiporter MnhD subunit